MVRNGWSTIQTWITWILTNSKSSSTIVSLTLSWITTFQTSLNQPRSFSIRPHQNHLWVPTNCLGKTCSIGAASIKNSGEQTSLSMICCRESMHPITWSPKQLLFNGCFNWMMIQTFTWEMVVSPNIHPFQNWLFWRMVIFGMSILVLSDISNVHHHLLE